MFIFNSPRNEKLRGDQSEISWGNFPLPRDFSIQFKHPSLC